MKKLKTAGYVRDNQCHNPKHRVPAWFKVATAIFHLAHGGTWFQTGFVAGVSETTAHRYTAQTCEGIIDVIRPIYMRKPTPAEAAIEVQEALW